MTLSLYGLAIPLIVQVSVGWAKSLGFPTRFAPHLASALGIACAVTAAILNGQPILWGVIAGVFLGAIASGAYDAALGRPADKPVDEVLPPI